MIYLTGVAGAGVLEVAQARPRVDLGMLAQPDGHDHRIAEWPVWAADNGCYAAGDRFDLARWLGWLGSRPARDRCLFAAAPDVVGDPVATLERSLPVLPVIRELGYPAALVAQDGLERMEIPWGAFDALFLGGSTEWKIGPALELVGRAHAEGKHVHMGRVNSHRRWRLARDYGVDSCDGTFLAYGPDVLMRRLQAWLDDDQLALPFR